jgi:hypothetical protein
MTSIDVANALFQAKLIPDAFKFTQDIEAIKDQSEKYFHSMMNIVTHEGYIKLAEKLNSIMPVKGDRKISGGYVRDTVFYSILDNEWETVKLNVERKLGVK